MSNVSSTLEPPTSTGPSRELVNTPSQRELAFKTFGVMDAGKQDRKSVAVSLVANGLALAAVVAISLTAKKIIAPTNKLSNVTFTPIPKVEPPPPPPPVKLPKIPVIKTVTPPPVNPPVVEVPEPPKVQPIVAKNAPPKPAVEAPAPKTVTPPPAPTVNPIHIAQAAAVPNNDPHPSAIRLGSMTNPINNTSGPAVSPVNLGRSGAPGMNAGNTGLGSPTKIAIGGSGSPNGSQGGTANAVQPIKGLANGVPGGTGTARPAGAVAIATNNAPVAIAQPTATTSTAPPKTAPKVLYKPRPEYTEEAKQLHLEGTVSVKIHVSAAGAVSVIGVQSGLGHGLDQSAVRAVQAMRFQPALQNGQPTDWDGVVSIAFQLAG